MVQPGKKQAFNKQDLLVLRLLKQRHRPVAVEKALGRKNSTVTQLRALARNRGWTFPPMPKTSAPCTLQEYCAACAAAGVTPDPDVMASLTPPVEMPWPHLIHYPLPEAPRSKAAGEQAIRLFKAVRHLRRVPVAAAAGGTQPFARECVEHLAMLIAYAPGRAYPDDPRAARPEPRLGFAVSFAAGAALNPEAVW